MNTWTKLLAVSTIFIAGTGTGLTKSYPSGPITLIVPFAPGASADGIARLIAKDLSTSTGQTVIVENKPGGGGVNGLLLLANAKADGYTIAIGATGAIVVNPHLPDGGKLDPQQHLTPLAKLVDIPLVMIAGKDSGFTSIADLLAKTKKGTGDTTYGTPGQYTAQHLAGELLASMTETDLIAVPYRGSAPAVADILGGQLPTAIVDLTSAATLIQANKVIALGVTSPERSRIAPTIPTIAESGVPNYSATAWLGMFAPANTPTPVVEKLSASLEAALTNKEVQERIMSLSAEPAYLSAQKFAPFIVNELNKWGSIISASTATAQQAH